MENKRRMLIREFPLLLEQSRKAVIANLIISTGYVYLSWDIVHHEWLFPWLLCVWALNLYRGIYDSYLTRNIYKLSNQQKHRAEVIVLTAITVSGVLWGIVGFFFADVDSSLHLGVTSFVLAGMSAGGVTAYSLNSLAVYLSTIPMLLPFALRLAIELEQPKFLVMSAMVIVFVIMLIQIGRTLNMKSSKVIGLGKEKDGLLTRLSYASHELKTPLSAIQGHAEMLEAGEFERDEIKPYAAVIKRNCEYLVSLTNNLLTLSSVESGKMEADNNWIELRELVNSVVSSVKGQADMKKITIDVSYGEDLPDIIYSDQTVLQQIIYNLLNNAIKFTDEGGVFVKVSCLNDQEVLVVNIKDTGIGIKKDSVDKIFTPLYREQRAIGVKGSGLGLALARGLAELLDGKLNLKKTQMDKGSEFELKIPVRGVKKKPILSNVDSMTDFRSRLSNTTVVLVEDSLDMRRLYKRTLERAGAKVETFSNGEEAVEFLRANKDVDLVVMDLNMPKMDGYEATEKLRDEGFKKPVLAVTAYSSLGMKDKCLQNGFCDFFEKTSGMSKFIHVIEANIKRAS